MSIWVSRKASSRGSKMTDIARVAEIDRPDEDARLEPSWRAALIVAHVERLASEASSPQVASCSAGFVRRVIAARAARRHHFESDLFADPAWDILLELYALRREQRRTSVSKLCIAAAVPTTTALRWLDKLQADGLVEREDDPCDGRRVWVALSAKGFRALEAYLHDIGNAFPI
jgi:DNA-binding MarR family transcriptional regulator